MEDWARYLAQGMEEESEALGVKRPRGSVLEQSIDISLLFGGETQLPAEPCFFPCGTPWES